MGTLPNMAKCGNIVHFTRTAKTGQAGLYQSFARLQLRRAGFRLEGPLLGLSERYAARKEMFMTRFVILSLLFFSQLALAFELKSGLICCLRSFVCL
jgi:hypothetical protein